MMSPQTELLIIGLAFLAGLLNFLLLGIIPLYFVVLAIMLIFGIRGMLRWFHDRRTSESQ
ncbi:hypothetical protein ACLRGI_15200 [Paenarthrobacter nitroguajacolicus]|uniref:hypothetical protein n=1 Tax=Paenarthrobacter nitroguajacolicus TaxID=211146 RepID=UPI003AE49107